MSNQKPCGGGGGVPLVVGGWGLTWWGVVPHVVVFIKNTAQKFLIPKTIGDIGTYTLNLPRIMVYDTLVFSLNEYFIELNQAK